VGATLDRFRLVLLAGPAIVAGDFNSTATADTRRKPTHANLVARLRDEFGLVSAYHHRHTIEQGCEPAATYFHLRKRAAPYHIDFCFVPLAWAGQIVSVQVLKGRPWCHLSDHRPVTVDVAMDSNRPPKNGV
jgi:endonuclease/exonuclease/phosphatase family metal-dependent hydrolase